MAEENGVLGLARIRANRGVSLEQIAEATKISIRALRAIEGGDFKKLPGGIYNTNYIRQYAKAIDFDPGTLLEYYYRQMGVRAPTDSNEQPQPKNDKPKGTFGGFRPSTILGL
ncbi:MAG TPA: helix-turn-helix domain-containing protein [Bryobacteraceae bacterium]|nr:helix-turn-helix domain-containing protein [Bryobacteraceae bacterium]